MLPAKKGTNLHDSSSLKIKTKYRESSSGRMIRLFFPYLYKANKSSLLNKIKLVLSHLWSSQFLQSVERIHARIPADHQLNKNFSERGC